MVIQGVFNIGETNVKRIDKIKNMTLDEMAEFLLDVYYQAETIVNFGRTEYIKQWLQQECEG